MTFLDIPDMIACEWSQGMVRLSLDDASTGWMSPDDAFIGRIRPDRLNACFLRDHILSEIRIKNILDEGAELLKLGKCGRAIGCFDEVLYYDACHGEALLYKSRALYAQKHFVKSLRHYRKAVRADSALRDEEYHRMLLRKSSAERDGFPKIKREIYAGDEYFARGDFANALERYSAALSNPTAFRDRILFKLLNKKASALMRLEKFDEAMETFSESIKSRPNDYAYFHRGCCEYELDLDALESLCNASDITLSQLLEKSEILCRQGHFEESLKCFDEMLSAHFSVDGLYCRAVRGKIRVLDALGRDSSAEKRICDKLDLAGSDRVSRCEYPLGVNGKGDIFR